MPGVMGVQAALDLRSPDRRERDRERLHQHPAPHADERATTAPLAVIRATHVEPSAGSYASADKPERQVIHRPEKAEKAEKAGRTETPANAPGKPSTDDSSPNNESRNTASAEVPASRVVRAADAGH
jgi:ribonuclease III